MDHTLDQLEERLNPKRLAHEGADRAKEKAKDTALELRDRAIAEARANPKKAAGIGAGLVAAYLLQKNHLLVPLSLGAAAGYFGAKKALDEP